MCERDDERLDQAAHVVEPPVLGELGEHDRALLLDRAVVTRGDRHQQTVAPAEVVVQCRRVALSGGLDDALERHLVDAVGREHVLRGAEQRFSGVGRVACHITLSVNDYGAEGAIPSGSLWK